MVLRSRRVVLATRGTSMAMAGSAHPHRLVTELDAERIPTLLDAFFSIAPQEALCKRAETLVQQVQANPILAEYVGQRHGPELAIRAALELPPEASPALLSSADGYRFLAFATMLVQVHHLVGAPGRKRLTGIVRDALQSDVGLNPIALELATAAHLARRGFDVAFADLETGGGFDLLATRNGAEIEVECKTVSGDVGKQIHRRRFAQLAFRLLPVLRAALPGLSGGILARLVMPGRLDGQAERQGAIADTVGRALSTLEPFPGPEPCSVEITRFDTTGTPFDRPDLPDQDSIRAFARERLGADNPHILAFGRPREKAIVVVTESRRSDRILRGIMRQLKEAAETQFSRARPAVLAVQFVDISADEMLELARADSSDPARASGLQLASSAFLDSPKRDHIHTVVYRALGTASRTTSRREDVIEQAVSESAPSYVFRNPNHPLATDARYRAF
jgi:hypothetical protein